MTPSLVRMRQLTYAAIMCLTTAALAQREQPESPIDAALQDLTSQDLGTRDRGLSGLLAQSGTKIEGDSQNRRTSKTANRAVGSVPFAGNVVVWRKSGLIRTREH
jgi:hypothetical protein